MDEPPSTQGAATTSADQDFEDTHHENTTGRNHQIQRYKTIDTSTAAKR